MPPRTFTLPDQPVTAFSLPEQVVTAEAPLTTPSGWGSYRDMWAERDKARDAQMGEYQPLDPKRDKTPDWLKKAAAGFQSYPTAPSQETPAPTPPTDLGAGLVAPWADYGQYGGNPDEQVQSEMINPWRDLSEPGEISDVQDTTGGIRDPWASKRPTMGTRAIGAAMSPKTTGAESLGAAASGTPEEPALEGGIVRDNPYGESEAKKKPEPDAGSVKKAANAFSTVFEAVKGSSSGVDQYKPREAQNVEITGARFRTAGDGSVFFRGADGAEYLMNPQDPNVQRAMALDAQRTRPAPTDPWERIRRGQ